ncbi:GGDEF domain-containing protein [Acinetobacter apis]|uniref:diguanylate cyclase n=1 Tax=Acinetobacter apis TaxID=1229165 RepID=A0A217EHC0_9GAMM|nr:diguanylate cyclase [Acinetobacter apis]SNQ29712.1 diguanylate cyclase (GGDEF) domain-containing protein [Acinetobacter apis]
MERLSTHYYVTWVAITVWCILTTTLFVIYGTPKPFAHWNWVDILGEGGVTIFVCIWLILILKSRPDGRVTAYIIYGLCFIFFHLWADTLDEFIRLPKSISWNNWLESVPFPIGIACLTLGIYYWHQEQIAISKHLLKRERHVRDHRLFDALTPLADANYFKIQLDDIIQKFPQQEHCVILLDMKQFAQINQHHGFKEGSLVLQYVSQVLTLNIKPNDLVCRLAGDRFVILLPNTPLYRAEHMQYQLSQVIELSHYYSESNSVRIPLAVSSACILVQQPTAKDVLKTLNQTLHRNKNNLAKAHVIYEL